MFQCVELELIGYVFPSPVEADGFGRLGRKGGEGNLFIYNACDSKRISGECTLLITDFNHMLVRGLYARAANGIKIKTNYNTFVRSRMGK